MLRLAKQLCFGVLAAFGLTIWTPAAAQSDPEDAAKPIEQAGKKSEPRPPLIPTKSFAGRAFFYSAKLSPDGKLLAYMQRPESGERVVVLNVDTMELVSAPNVGAEEDIRWFRWAGNDRILLSISVKSRWYGEMQDFTRLMLHDPKTQKTIQLGKKSAVLQGDNVIHVAKDGSFALVSVQRTVYDYPSVYRYELKEDGAITQVEKPRENVWDWYTDDAGVVRLGLGWRNRRMNVWYRENADAKLRKIARLKEGDEDSFFDVSKIVSGSDEGYVLREGENGKVGVQRFNYATREIVETFYANPDWDVESLWIDDEGKPFAAFYTDDREQVVWFDEEYKKLYATLQKALGDQEIWVSSRSKDKQRLLVSVGSESDPGVLYFFDRQTNRMQELGAYRPEIDFRQTVKPKAISYMARDGTDIRAFLTLPRGREAKGLPLIILPHGGPFGIRDRLRYDDEVQFLANRGYAVIQPNFRGSGGYGQDFYDLGIGQVGRGMQDDLDDAMDWAVAEGIADPARVCVVGGSYGGYAALWAVLRNPERYRCAASWAGVTDWDKMLKYDRRYLTRKASKRWNKEIEGEEEFDLDQVSPYRLAAQLSRPVLLAHGTEDSNVPIKQFELMKKAARKAPVPMETLVIEGEGHSFSKASSEQAWYDALDTFLKQHNPAD